VQQILAELAARARETMKEIEKDRGGENERGRMKG